MTLLAKQQNIRLLSDEKDLVVDLFTTTILIVCAVFNYYFFTGYISLVTFGIYLFYLVASRPILILKYSWCILFTAMQVGGVFAIEFGSVELPELFRESSFAGSLPLIVFFRFCLLLVIKYADAALDKRNGAIVNELKKSSTTSTKKITHKISTLVLLLSVVFFLTIFFWLLIATKPAPMLSMDRFDYYQEYIGGNFLLEKINNSFIPLAICAACCFADKTNIRKAGIFGCILYVLIHVWIGNKFSELVPAFCLILLIGSSFLLTRFGKKKLAFLLLTGLAFFVLYAIIIQATSHELEPIEYFFSRFSQQGQIWWATFQQISTAHFSQLPQELISQILTNDSTSDNLTSNYGLYKIMYLCAPSWIVEMYLSNGTTFAEFGYALAYYYAGIFGALVLSLLSGLGIALTTNALIKYAHAYKLVGVAFLSVFFSGFNALLGTGSIHFLFSATAIIGYVVLGTEALLLRPPKRSSSPFDSFSKISPPE